MKYLKVNSMKLNLVLISLLIISLGSCSKDDSIKNLDLTGTFSGDMSAGTIKNTLEGSFSISHNFFSLQTSAGELSGNAELANEAYELTNLSGSGLFDGSTSMNGQLNKVGQNLTIIGDFVDGSNLSINGMFSLEEWNQNFSDTKLKSKVFFKLDENETCTASITINGVTLNPLNNFYQENRYCSPDALVNILIDNDIDLKSSQLLCNTITLQDPNNGTFNTFESCTVAVFVVDKNTAYNYTIEWQNGEITTGIFTSSDGGRGLSICPDNPGEPCDNTTATGQVGILENTLTIDASKSSTSDSLTLNFVNKVFYSEFSNFISFGDYDTGSSLFFYPVSDEAV